MLDQYSMSPHNAPYIYVHTLLIIHTVTPTQQLALKFFHVHTLHTVELLVQSQHPQYQDNDDEQGKE